MFEVTLLSSTQEGDIRKASFQTCDAVCSKQIDIELDGETILSVHFTGGCHGNSQGLSALAVGMDKADVITRLEGINCKARGTSCPDQLARALKML